MGDTNEKEILEGLLQEAARLGATENDEWITFPVPARIALLKKDIELAQERRELAQERRENASLKEITISRTYGDKTPFQPLPRLQINNKVEPSCKGNTRNVTIRNTDGAKIRTEITIPEANIIRCNKEMWLDPNEVVIPAKNSDGSNEPSLLGALCRNKGTPLTYANEFDIQELCKNKILDGLAGLGISREYVESHLEVSIYGMKPDIIIVLTFEGRIMLEFEIKSPERPNKNDSVFTSKKVAGQMWSYLIGMKASGVQRPMGVVMTYNKIVLVTLEDYSNDATHLKKVAKAKKDLGSGVTQKVDLAPEEPKCEERLKSPPKPSISFTKASMAFDNKMKESVHGLRGEDGDEQRITTIPLEKTVYYSEVYEDNKVFPCLLQALHIAFQYTQENELTTIPRLDNEDPIGSRLAFEIGPSSYDWVITAGETKAKVNNRIPKITAKKYLNLGKLGVGSKSTAYLACSVTGQSCAIKDYHMQPSKAATELQREIDDDNMRETLYAAAVFEQERWATLYKERFETRVVYLGGKPCLILPYGHDIGSEDERWERIPAIFDELVRIGNFRLMYKKRDLRWRHILDDAYGILFFCDLESLTEIPEGKSVHDVVYDQLEILLRTLRPDDDKDADANTLRWMSSRNNFGGLTAVIKDSDILKHFLSATEMSNLPETLVSLFPAEKEVGDLSSRAKVFLTMIGYLKSIKNSKKARQTPHLGPEGDETKEDEPSKKRAKVETI